MSKQQATNAQLACCSQPAPAGLFSDSGRAALYTFAAHYHSGQGSRGYALLCRAERAWERRAGIGVRLDYWERLVETAPSSEVARLYWRLVEAHGECI